MKTGKTLVDFSPLKAGGGCQLALNFITELQINKVDCSSYIFLIPNSGPLSDLQCQFPYLHYIVSPSSSYLKRIYFEYFKLRRIYNEFNIKKIFTFFGAGLPHPNQIKSIVSVAYPIICYDDSPYWKYIPTKRKHRQILINYLRINRLKKADAIIVETRIMAERLSLVMEKDISQYRIIPPTPSRFVLENVKTIDPGENFIFLFLSGVAHHKNLWRLPEIGKELAVYTEKFTFMISASEKAFLNHLNQEQTNIYQTVSEHFKFVGSVALDKINQVYLNSDALVSLSDLESFSNNYMEAWKAGVPLIVSDRDFSRFICEDSALYIEPHSPKLVANVLKDVINNSIQLKDLVIKGKERMKSLPESKAKYTLLTSFIENYQ